MTTQSERELTAARWLIEQEDPAFSDAQTERLAKWLMQSYENMDAYIEMARAWHWTVLLYSDEPPLAHGRHSRGPTSGRTRSPSRMISLNRRLSELLRCLRETQRLSASDNVHRARSER